MPVFAARNDFIVEVLVSPEDECWASGIIWNLTTSGYAAKRINGVYVFLHKEILRRAFVLPPSPLHHIGDHRNGKTLDNRRGNLRWATKSMNARNRFGFIDQQKELDLWHFSRR